MRDLLHISLIAALLTTACTEPKPAGRPLLALDDLGGAEWTAVSAGRDHTCGLTHVGLAYCWGSNSSSQLLAPTDGPAMCQFSTAVAPRACSPSPYPVLSSIRFLAISAGAQHTCAIAQDRSVYCWGDNAKGQLGASSPAQGVVHVASSIGFASISAGSLHTCGVRTDGALLCWGGNERGQLGTGDHIAWSSPVRVQGGLSYASVSAGDGRTCARTTTSAVYCWGAIWMYRQNGLEFTRDQTTPERVFGAPQLIALSVGSFTTCGPDPSGVLFCWEANPYGQMGTGTTNGSTAPVPVASTERFASVSAGILQTCAIAVSGAGYCWGNDSFGQLGVPQTDLTERCADQNLSCATTPKPVFGRQQFVSISTSFGNHTCGVSTKGNLYCWGLGWLGQLGDGRASYTESVPVLVPAPTGP